MSKVDTLQAAISYIRELQKALDEVDNSTDESCVSPGSSEGTNSHTDSVSSPGSFSSAGEHWNACSPNLYTENTQIQSSSYENSYCTPLQPISNHNRCDSNSWNIQTTDYNYPYQQYRPQATLTSPDHGGYHDNTDTYQSQLDLEESQLLEMVSTFF